MYNRDQRQRGRAYLAGFIAGAVLIVTLTCASHATAAVIHDNFDGSAGGWSTGWISIYSFIESSPINGNAMRVSARGNFDVTSATRRFPTISDGNVYVSVLAHAQNLSPLVRGSFSAGFDFTLGPTPVPSHPTNLPPWGLGFSSNTRKLYLSGAAPGPAVADNVTYRLVTRITQGAGGNYEFVDVWQNPVAESASPALSGSMAGGVTGINSFVARGQNASGNSYFDEVVIGGSFAEVVYFTGDTASVAPGAIINAELLGSSTGNVGGIDVAFDNLSVGGDLTARFERVNSATFENRFGVAPGDSGIAMPGQDSFSVWDVSLPDGEFTAADLHVQFGPDDLPTGFDETQLALWHFNAGRGAFEPLSTLGIDTVNHVLGARTGSFSTFVLGAAVPLPATKWLFAPTLAGLFFVRRTG